MIRKPKVIHFWRGRLPHMQVEDGRYFVTLHLAEAIPNVSQHRIHQEALALKAATQKWNRKVTLAIARMVFRELEKWLDKSNYVRYLTQQPIAEIVMESLQHRQHGNRWHIFDSVIMPNHLHMFFEIDNELSLKTEMELFKQWTSRQAKKLQGPSERFWQVEWFDHWSRSAEQDENIIRYIANNPVKAGLVNCAEDWPYRFPVGLSRRDRPSK